MMQCSQDPNSKFYVKGKVWIEDVAMSGEENDSTPRPLLSIILCRFVYGSPIPSHL